MLNLNKSGDFFWCVRKCHHLPEKRGCGGSISEVQPPVESYLVFKMFIIEFNKLEVYSKW